MSDIRFPQDFTEKLSPSWDDLLILWDSDSLDTEWNANVDKKIKLSSLSGYILWAWNTDSLEEWTDNLYYTDARVSSNSTVMSLWNNKADKSNVIEKNSTTPFTPTLWTHPANKDYVDNAGTNITWLTEEAWVANWDEFIYYNGSENVKVDYEDVKNDILSNQVSEIVSVPTITFDDVAQTDVTINHNLGKVPKNIELINRYNNGIAWLWCDNNWNITSYARYSSGEGRITTSDETLITHISNNWPFNIWDWRIKTITSTQIVLEYVIVSDGGSWSRSTYDDFYIKITA